ncbi:RHS repeat-associated protein [Litorimonas taeanensis]|uniref:RHS repeat-associated protein n=2 Tax=Litorimonas taeanensis TaxID=568099 RepID=A0A420WDN7_9PROT|nr:RHS repeat-associated protein [Litorimonas taeanensis]
MGAVTQSLMFPGQYADEETGYYDNWHRTYDPALGRYLQSDPIGLAGGFNRYAYVGGNPVNYVDFQGLSGILTIYSKDGEGGFGHSFLSFQKDSDNCNCEKQTFSFWPGPIPLIVPDRGQKNGLNRNFYLDDVNSTKYSSRSVYLNDKMEIEFMRIIKKLNI